MFKNIKNKYQNTEIKETKFDEENDIENQFQEQMKFKYTIKIHIQKKKE